MSWLFGRRSGPSEPPPPEFPRFPDPSAGGSDDEKARKSMEAYRFDSTALERAAQAARDLEKSS